MRLIKALGLAAIAALAAMASVGAGSASADVLCKSKPGHLQACPKKDTIDVGLVKWLAKEAVFLDEEGLPLVNCHSKALGLIEENEGPHKGLVLKISTMDFSECEGFFCSKARAHSAPFILLMDATTLDAWLFPDNMVKLLPGAVIEECLFGAKCLYQVPSEKTLLSIKEDMLIAKDVLMKLSTASMLCPDETWFDATYLLTLDNDVTPNPLYLTALGRNLSELGPAGGVGSSLPKGCPRPAAGLGPSSPSSPRGGGPKGRVQARPFL